MSPAHRRDATRRRAHRHARCAPRALQRALALVATAWLACAGCTVTDTGNPALRPEVDPTLVTYVTLAADIVTLAAQPGTVDPPAGIVRVTNLDTAADPIDAPVAEDGSFDLSVLARIDDELRLQVVDGAARSAPIDFTPSGDGDGIDPIVREPACLTLDPTLELDAGTLREAVERVVTVANGCPDAVVLGAPTLRRLPVGLAISPDLAAATLPPSEQTSLRIRIEPAAAGAHEEVLLLPIEAPVVGRRAITVVATVP